MEKKIKKLLKETRELPANERITELFSELMREHYRQRHADAIKRGKANAAKERSLRSPNHCH